MNEELNIINKVRDNLFDLYSEMGIATLFLIRKGIMRK